MFAVLVSLDAFAVSANLVAIFPAAVPTTGNEDAKVATKAAVYRLPVAIEDITKSAAFIARLAKFPIPGINDATKATEDIIVENAFKKEFLAFKW